MVSSLYPILQIPQDNDLAASHICSKPATSAPASPSHRQLQTSSGITKQQTPTSTATLVLASPSNNTGSPALASPSSRHLYHPSSRVTTLLRLALAVQGHINIPLVNEGLNKPGSLCNQCIHIFDHLQLCLQPDHTAIPTICTKHQDYPPDHPDPLNALSPKTYWQPSLRLSTALTFTPSRNYTYAHLSCMIHSIKSDI